MYIMERYWKNNIIFLVFYFIFRFSEKGVSQKFFICQIALKQPQEFGSASSRSTPGASEPRGILTESHPASAGLPTFVAGRQKWVAEGKILSLHFDQPAPLKRSKNFPSF